MNYMSASGSVTTSPFMIVILLEAYDAQIHLGHAG
jgi:hypothetical protein